MSVKTIYVFAGILIVFLCAKQARLQVVSETEIHGKVLDQRSMPVANAGITVVSASGQKTSCTSGREGNFVCRIVLNTGFRLEIDAPGFGKLHLDFSSMDELPADGEFTLFPAQIRDEVVVTAARTGMRIGDTPASITIFSRAEIESTGAQTIDDTLRQSAGFSIFRRSSSRNANPTTQGVSLRGVGASGASRSLVLSDGVPLNDVFGGWVQWARVSSVSIEHVEVLRGGASSLYGDGSLSGAINIIPREADDKLAFSAEIFGGTQRTVSGSVFSGFKDANWTFDLTGSRYQTKGYMAVDETKRGIVDSFVGMRSSNYSARIGRQIGDSLSIFVRPSIFGEVRTNGTGLQTNRTHIRQIIFGGEIDLTQFKIPLTHSRLDWRLFGGTQVFDQVFSAVNFARTSESLTRVQRVPAQNVGLSAQFTGVYKIQTFVAGMELRNVRGASDEIAFSNNAPTAIIGAGGREQAVGIFFQDFAKIGKNLVIAGAMRFDRWRNFRALSSTRTLSTNQTVTTSFPDRTDKAVSPSISILYHASDEFSLFANASRSFRAPTLNELYRSFRVGNILTLANENLRAERAGNVEAGISFGRKRTYLRGGAFWTSIDRPVANVTLTSTPALVTRQRRNAGRTRSRGIEIEAETNLKQLNFSFGYLFADSRVASFPSNSTLEGLSIPQVARHQFTFQTRYTDRGWTFALQGRASSSQFDDDLNLFRLEPYFQLDVFIEKTIKSDFRVFAGVENLFNSRYSVGLTPIRTVSSPLNIRTGLRWN